MPNSPLGKFAGILAGDSVMLYLPIVRIPRKIVGPRIMFYIPTFTQHLFGTVDLWSY